MVSVLKSGIRYSAWPRGRSVAFSILPTQKYFTLRAAGGSIVLQTSKKMQEVVCCQVVCQFNLFQVIRTCTWFGQIVLLRLQWVHLQSVIASWACVGTGLQAWMSWPWALALHHRRMCSNNTRSRCSSLAALASCSLASTDTTHLIKVETGFVPPSVL